MKFQTNPPGADELIPLYAYIKRVSPVQRGAFIAR